VEGGEDRTVKARELWDQIAVAAWPSAAPAVQFSDTTNEHHTAAYDGAIVARKPCCFVGETLVDTVKGAIPIAELARMDAAGEELPSVFCWNGHLTSRKINKAWCAGTSKEIATVTLEDGRVFECTPEHRWLLSGDVWV